MRYPTGPSPRCRQPYSVSIETPSISDNSGRVISGSVDFLPGIIFLSPPDASVVRRSKPAIEPFRYQAMDSSYLVTSDGQVALSPPSLWITGAPETARAFLWRTTVAGGH